jgi:signal transduction histidine kinase
LNKEIVSLKPINGLLGLNHNRYCDQGAGIALADQQLLFNRFCQVHDRATIRAKGFGLGLFLSEKIIEAHGGKVWLKSHPGKGSIFGFTIPSVCYI